MPGGHIGHKGAHAGHSGLSKQTTGARQKGAGIEDGDRKTKGESWAAQLTDEERSTVKAYGEDTFIRINSSLRAGGTEPEVDIIDRALAKSSLDKDTTVFRGGIDPGGGKIFRDRGFTSTTLNNTGLDAYDAVWEIKVSRGTHAAYIDYVKGTAGTRMDEKELLLQRGLNYRIMKREKVGNKIKIVAEVVR